MMKGIFTAEFSKSTSVIASPSYVFVAAPGPKADDAEGTMPKTYTKDWEKNNVKLENIH